MIFFSFRSPYFFTAENISNLLLAVSVIGTMAAVSTLLIIGRGIDLSLGSICALCGLLTSMLIEELHVPWMLGIPLGLLAGGICGAFNGIIVARFNISPIITTIGTLSVFRGLAYVAKDGQPVLVSSDQLLFFGAQKFLGLPASVWILAAVLALCHFIALRTTYGRGVFAVGASPRAALIAGLDVPLYRFSLYVASGVSAALAGIMMSGQAGTATPSAANAYELWVITAVLLGGTSLNGGSGSVARTALGVLIIGVLNNGMILVSVPTFYQIIANGTLLLAAVIIDQLHQSRGAVLKDV
ncbi:ABC transporter permease [Pigmentiphaga soli]